jgi:hypothetical protein
MHRGWLRTVLLVLSASASGCAIYDPWQVWRYHVDYNSERQWSAQISFSDHLPPPPVRVKMIRWGYNVGLPIQHSSTWPPSTLQYAPPPVQPLPPAPVPESFPAQHFEQAASDPVWAYPVFELSERLQPTATSNTPRSVVANNGSAAQRAPSAPAGTWLFSRPAP